MREYLEYVRSPAGPFESSEEVATLYEWTDDVPDAFEVSVFRKPR